jgi:hypothetical protein
VPARDDVGKSVDCRAEPGLKVVICGLQVLLEAGVGFGLGGLIAEAEVVDGLAPGICRVLDRLEAGVPVIWLLPEPADANQ